MMKKKMMAAFLGATMLISVGAPALAVDKNAPAQNAAVYEGIRMPERELAMTTITEIGKDDQGEITFIMTKVPGEDNSEVMLRVGAETMVLDNKTGIPAGLQDLKVGDSIAAFHSPAMTMSLPPQTFAEAIVYHIGEGEHNAMLHTVEQVIKTEEGARILTDEGSLYIAVKKDAAVSPLYTKNIVTLDDIRVGDRIFAWYSIVLTSYPGQTGTDKLVLAPAKDAEKNQVTITGAGETVVLSKAEVTKDKMTMLPLRAVAEALGYTVSWNGAEQTAAVHRAKGELSLSAKIGTDGAYIDEHYRTWVSAEVFEDLGLHITLD